MGKKYMLHPVILLGLLCLISFSACPKSQETNPPRLTVVMIIDQFAYHYLPKVGKHLRYGIKKLLDKGVVCKNAYYPHAIPETTTGHHAISTGTLPCMHGGVLNQWINKQYQDVRYDTDNDPSAKVFDDTQKNFCGKSSANTMVDGLSDQYALSSKPNAARKVFALSLKSHPAISTANKQGKAIWLDWATGNFTSSKKYFDQLPEWLTQFNANHGILKMKELSWQTMYEPDNAAYNFPDIKNYDYAAYDFSLISLPSIAIDNTKKNPYELFAKTPQASQSLIDLTKTCIEQNLQQESDHMLIWLSISTLDLIGHIYGPDSIEAIDTLYHLDKQIQDFMDFAKKQVGSKNCLFVLTGDHGIPSIPEISQKRGLPFARRIMADPLIKSINSMIEKKYNLHDIIKRFDHTYFVINKEAFNPLDQETKKAVTLDIKEFLKKQDGIKQVWTATELEQTTFAPDQLENFYKSQLFAGRFRDIICMPEQYCLLTNYPTGTSHLSPYEYDTHVPLVIYQKSRFEKKQINKKVWMPQLPVTLAHILNIAKPSASTYEILPGVIQ